MRCRSSNRRSRGLARAADRGWPRKVGQGFVIVFGARTARYPLVAALLLAGSSAAITCASRALKIGEDARPLADARGTLAKLIRRRCPLVRPRLRGQMFEHESEGQGSQRSSGAAVDFEGTTANDSKVS
jgi:hypothetical protein